MKVKWEYWSNEKPIACLTCGQENTEKLDPTPILTDEKAVPDTRHAFHFIQKLKDRYGDRLRSVDITTNVYLWIGTTQK